MAAGGRGHMRTVGRYRLVEELGRGGVATVFRALDPEGRRVALKLLHRGALAAEGARRRFEAEAQALLRVRHPQVAALLDAGEDGGAPYLVLEHVDGETLERRLAREGPLPPRAAAELARKLALGLAHCHAAGVLHRDLKPENVLLRAASGEPVLVDFGLAREVEAHLSRGDALTREGTLLGTPGYWAPEQARGERAAMGPATDVYGLGAALYAALTGAPPQEGETLPELLLALERDPAPPSTRRAGVPAELDAVVLRCLERDPRRRYPDAAALARDLERCLEGRRARPRARGVALGAALLAAVAGAWWARGDPAAAPAPRSPAALGSEVAASAPTASAAGDEPSLVGWRVPLAEARRLTVRPDALSAAVMDETVGAAWTRLLRGQWTLAAYERQLAPILAAGHTRAQRDLGRYLVQRGEDPVRAARLLWLASREPSAMARAGLQLAPLVFRGAPGLAADPQAARYLLEEAEGRIPPAEWDLDLLLEAAAVWARLGRPGDLGRSLRLLRSLSGRPPEQQAGARSFLDGQSPGRLTEPALLAVARWEGWLGAEGPPAPSLGQLLPDDAGVARAWLRLAAAVGDTEALTLLLAAGEPVPDPEALDPLDLLGMDGSRAVLRPVDLEQRLSLRTALLRLRESPGQLTPEGLREVRRLAATGYADAQWELGQAHARGHGTAKDERRGLAGWALGALDSGRPDGIPGHADARAAVGRALVMGLGCPPRPADAVPWLRSALERETSREGGLEARLWLGLCSFSGRGVDQDVQGGLQAMRQALEAAAEDDDHPVRLRRLARTDRWAEWARGLLGLEPMAWSSLNQAAREDPAARHLLDALPDLPELPAELRAAARRARAASRDPGQ